MPEVTVVLHTIYQIQTPDGVVTKRVMPIEPGLNVGKLLQELGVTIYDDSTLLVVNGKIVAEDHLLQDGDEFHLIPAISGGSQPMER